MPLGIDKRKPAFLFYVAHCLPRKIKTKFILTFVLSYLIFSLTKKSKI